MMEFQRPVNRIGSPQNETGLCTLWSIAFRHLPPNSARFGYATEGALFISAQLSTDAVSALRKIWVRIKLQALVYDSLPFREGAGKRCSECEY